MSKVNNVWINNNLVTLGIENIIQAMTDNQGFDEKRKYVRCRELVKNDVSRM